MVPPPLRLARLGETGMRKDVREFIRRLEAVGLTVEPTPGHYRVLRDGKPLRKANGMPFMLPFSPDTIRWRRAYGEDCSPSISAAARGETLSSCSGAVGACSRSTPRQKQSNGCCGAAI
jgi:hypothetical protein